MAHIARLVVCAALVSSPALARLPNQKVAERRTSTADLSLTYERVVLPNGLVVLLNPLPTANEVVVDLSFVGGALTEPADKAGLAHLVEHVLATGDTPATNYRDLLERRGATAFNALTSLDRLSFRVAVPPEELPLALWANADRLGTLPPLITDAVVERHRRIVLQEKLLRIDDQPFATTSKAFMGALFPTGHPLHDGVMGTEASLARVTAADVRAHAARCLTPSNGVLTVVGRFERAQALQLIEASLGELPSGAGPVVPSRPPPLDETRTMQVVEDLSRKPRITMAWALTDPFPGTIEALSLGAVLMTIYTDGLVGMSVDAEFIEYPRGGLFVMTVTMPHALDPLEASNNAEVVYRNLVQGAASSDVIVSTFHALDRVFLQTLTSTHALASMLTRLEVSRDVPRGPMGYFERHWRLTPEQVRDAAAAALKTPHLIVRANPVRPLPKRPER